MQRAGPAMACLLACVVGLGAGCRREGGGASDAAEPLLLYCGAGLRDAVAPIVDAFEAHTGLRVQTDYAGSNVLLARIEVAREGDLYIPGDEQYVEQAAHKGLVASQRPLCVFVPVILVHVRNPHGIATLADLARPGLQIGLGDPEACAIGAISQDLLANAGVEPMQVEPNVVFRSLTVDELGVQMTAGKLDAVIVFDAVARRYADATEIIEIPPSQNSVSTVPIATLTCSTQPERAREFVEFATSEAGRSILEAQGYSIDAPR